MNELSFIRGDSFPFKFDVTNKDGVIMDKTQIKSMILTCRKHASEDSKILFTKNIDDFTFEDEYYHGCFEPEDTQELNYGKYHFDIEVTSNSGYRKTLKSHFEITEETTIHKEGEEASE